MKQLRTSTASPDPEADALGPSFQDWAHLISFRPRLYFRPQSIDELKGFLLGFCSNGPFAGKTPRVLGGLHSCSDICISDAIIDVSDMPQTIEFGPDDCSVTVTANWHFHDFLLALSQRGKSISATGGTDEQTLAGIISTNTAPATPQTTIYELLQWVEYLTVDEEQQTIVEKRVLRADPDFRAVIGSLGAIGVITRVNFNLIDELYFRTTQKIIKLKDVLTNINLTSQKYDFWRIDWIPDTDDGLLWAAQRVPSAEKNGDYPIDQSENVLEFLFKLLEDLEPSGPLLDTPMRVVYAGLTLAYGEIVVSGPLRNMLPVDRRAPLRVAMAEWSFDPADLNRLLASCRSYFQQHGWPNLPIEIELTKTDDYYMSAWNWPGLDYIVKFNFMYMTDTCNTPAEKAAIYTHLQGLWNHFKQDGIPFKAHWGKINFIDMQYVNQVLHFDQFKPFIRPMFLNQYLTDRFYK